jgi:hypothetical protein
MDARTRHDGGQRYFVLCVFFLLLYELSWGWDGMAMSVRLPSLASERNDIKYLQFMSHIE